MNLSRFNPVKTTSFQFKLVDICRSEIDFQLFSSVRMMVQFLLNHLNTLISKILVTKLRFEYNHDLNPVGGTFMVTHVRIYRSRFRYFQSLRNRLITWTQEIVLTFHFHLTLT